MTLTREATMIDKAGNDEFSGEIRTGFQGGNELRCPHL
jgi:hypothetical protein